MPRQSGLADGGKKESLTCFPPLTGLPFLDRGEFALLLPRLAGVPLIGVRERGYRGGVTYWVPGVVGGVALGSSPSRARWDGVRAMSVTSSFCLARGINAVAMFHNSTMRRSHSGHPSPMRYRGRTRECRFGL